MENEKEQQITLDSELEKVKNQEASQAQDFNSEIKNEAAAEEKKPEVSATPEVKEIHHHHYEKKPRPLGRIYFALILVLLGVYYFARNLGLIPPQFDLDLWQLWPLAIIFFGLAIMSARSWFSVIVSLVVLMIVVFGIFIFFSANNYQDIKQVDQKISINKTDNIKTAELEIKSGLGEIRINGGSNELVSGDFKSSFSDLSAESLTIGDRQSVSLVTNSWNNNLGMGSMMRRGANNLNVSLNSEMPFIINLSSGASKMNLDLSKVITQSVVIDTGASDLTLIMGDKQEKADVAISAGASNLRLILPKTIGARVSLSNGLSSENLKDLKKVGDNIYESDNYAAAVKKIDLNLKLGASSLTVDWQ